jgi:hypothetical protein
MIMLSVRSTANDRSVVWHASMHAVEQDRVDDGAPVLVERDEEAPAVAVVTLNRSVT